MADSFDLILWATSLSYLWVVSISLSSWALVFLASSTEFLSGAKSGKSTVSYPVLGD